MRKTAIAAGLIAAGAFAVLGSAGTALASPAPVTPAGTVAYEVDNGTAWTLADRTGFGGVVTSTGSAKGYADAGVVVDLGPASSFTGITIKGSAGLADNIWIADGTDATVPGTHQLASPPNFDYGLGQPGGGTWYMTGKPDAYNGKTLTDAQIRSDFHADQVWAWVGIANAGTAGYGYVTSVNGHPADAIVGTEAQGGKVTAYVLPFGLFGMPFGF